MAIELRQLSQRMLGLSKRVETNANEIVKAVSTSFITEVIMTAPVDKGQLVSSWKVGLNYHPTGVRTFVPGIKGSTAAANRQAALADVLPKIARRVTGQTITFLNETPYLEYVNKGEYQRQIELAYKRAFEAGRRKKVLE